MSKSFDYAAKLRADIFEKIYSSKEWEEMQEADKIIDSLAELFLEKIIESHKKEKKLKFFNKVKNYIYGD